MAGDDYLLVSQQPANRPFRAGIRISDASLVVLDEQGSIDREFALDGSTLEQGYAWLVSAIGENPEAGPEILTRPSHAMPELEAGEGAPFSFDNPVALEELKRWYRNGEYILQWVAGQEEEASPVRCWPHHFDIATLFVLDPEKSSDEARSIGVGVIPGDASYHEPYVYVTPWPYPYDQRLPMLEGGHWHTEGWYGAVMAGSELVAAGSGLDQLHYLREFLESAIAACRMLLGR
jgi:hypothetical protein